MIPAQQRRVDDLAKWGDALHREVEDLLMRVRLDLLAMNDAIRKQERPPGEQADFGYWLRQTELQLDELRKEVKAKRELVGKILAANTIAANMADSSKDLTVRGEVAMAIPDMAQRISVPKHGTKEYERLARQLGVPPELIASGAMKFDFLRTSELLMSKQSTGEVGALPEGIRAFQEYVCTFRKKGSKAKERDEDADDEV